MSIFEDIEARAHRKRERGYECDVCRDEYIIARGSYGAYGWDGERVPCPACESFFSAVGYSLPWRKAAGIKIKKCSDSLMWYSRLVGLTVPFVREDGDGYWSRDPAGYINIIKKADAELVGLWR